MISMIPRLGGDFTQEQLLSEVVFLFLPKVMPHNEVLRRTLNGSSQPR
jgi:hypothetical protein